MSKADWVPVQIEVDAATIAGDSPHAVVEPVWWTANFGQDYAAYEDSLKPFSKPQRLVWAALWYASEVHNGGHDQFFSNATGMVWPDALEALSAIGREDLAAILSQAIGRFSSPPSRDTREREQQMEDDNVMFGELDPELWGACRAHNLSDSLMSYIRAWPDAFYFSGVLRRPLPRPHVKS